MRNFSSTFPPESQPFRCRLLHELIALLLPSLFPLTIKNTGNSVAPHLRDTFSPKIKILKVHKSIPLSCPYSSPFYCNCFFLFSCPYSSPAPISAPAPACAPTTPPFVLLLLPHLLPCSCCCSLSLQCSWPCSLHFLLYFIPSYALSPVPSPVLATPPTLSLRLLLPLILLPSFISARTPDLSTQLLLIIHITLIHPRSYSYSSPTPAPVPYISCLLLSLILLQPLLFSQSNSLFSSFFCSLFCSSPCSYSFSSLLLLSLSPAPPPLHRMLPEGLHIADIDRVLAEM